MKPAISRSPVWVRKSVLWGVGIGLLIDLFLAFRYLVLSPESQAPLAGEQGFLAAAALLTFPTAWVPRLFFTLPFFDAVPHSSLILGIITPPIGWVLIATVVGGWGRWWATRKR